MLTADYPSGLPGLSLTGVLGRGGFGTIYRARHHALDADVAVKVVGTAAEIAAAGLDRALHEARLMARLDHPNLLRVLHAGQADGAVYLVLELMDGSLRGTRCLPPDRAVSVTRQLLSGLQALHDARILHRDVKPANCLYRAHDGRVKLADLGISAEVVTAAPNNDWAGTIPFMAPELFEAPPRYSAATDLYALGVTLAALLLPSDPYPAGTRAELREWVANGTRSPVSVGRPDLQPALTRLVDRMMSPRAADRPGSAADALVALAGVEPVPATVRQHALPARLPSAASTPGAGETITGGSARVGPWVLGEIVHSSLNWVGQVVTHAHTGRPGRLFHLQPRAQISGDSPFILEAAARAARFDHPCLADVMDWGMAQGFAYVVASPHGRMLREVVADGGPLEEHVAVPFMAAVADALAYLHGQGFVHQIVDPGATVVGADARSALLAWPVFCVPAGSPTLDDEGNNQRFLVKEFAAPEVVSLAARTIEPSVDAFGLGATFHYLTAGPDAYKAARKEGKLPDLRLHSPGMTAPFAALLSALVNPDPRSGRRLRRSSTN